MIGICCADKKAQKIGIEKINVLKSNVSENGKRVYTYVMEGNCPRVVQAL
jgi:aspartate 1-decarboxylase